MHGEPRRRREAEHERGEVAAAEATTAHTFEREGCTLHWWEAGARDGPCLVLTHGVTIDHGTFATQVPLLVRAGCRVVTWDLRGHGQSRPAPQPRARSRHRAGRLAALRPPGDVAAAGGVRLGGADFARSTKAAAVALGRGDPPGVRHAPTLCLVGDAEIAFVARITRSWAERSTHARFAVLDGAGHLVNQEAPAAFSEAVAAFAHEFEARPAGGDR